jgi:pimeloyl-ACP methyl ester carboxylesterase
MNINTSVIAAITIGILGACVLPKINNAVVFYPKQIHVNELNKLSQKYAKHIELCDFNIKKDKLYGCLINISRRPSWNDTIFLYSHGNSGWFGQLTTYPQIAELSKYGSIFLYDYRGYGANSGKPSEKNCYEDILGAWNFLSKKGVPSSKIIVFGHSLGTSISTYLVSNLIKYNRQLPAALMLEAPFTSIRDMANHIYPGLEFLSMNKLNNIKYLKIIDDHNKQKNTKKIPILIMHSEIDEIVPYSQGRKLSKNVGCTFVNIEGSHNEPTYTSGVYNFLNKLFQ